MKYFIVSGEMKQSSDIGVAVFPALFKIIDIISKKFVVYFNYFDNFDSIVIAL